MSDEILVDLQDAEVFRMRRTLRSNCTFAGVWVCGRYVAGAMVRVNLFQVLRCEIEPECGIIDTPFQ